MTSIFNRDAIRLGLMLLLTVFLLGGTVPVRALQLRQDSDVFGNSGDSVVKKKTEKKESTKEANPFTPQTVPDPNAPVDPKVPDRKLPALTKEGRIQFERPQDKDPNELSEKEFYQTLTPAEKLILTRQPETGPEFFEAAALIARVGRPEFARLLLGKSIQATGSPEQYAAAVDRVGSDRVLYLVANPVIGPIGSEVANRVMSEAKKHWEDPKVIQAAVKMTSSQLEAQRVQGLLGIRKGGSASVAILFERLKSTNPGEVDEAKTLLKFLGDFGIDAMLVGLQTKDEKLLTLLIESLGKSRHPRIPDALLARYYGDTLSPELRDGILKPALVAQFGSIPTAQDAFDRLFAVVMDYYNRSKTAPSVIDGTVSDWMWDEATGMPLLKSFDEETYFRIKTVEQSAIMFPLAKKLEDRARYEKFLQYYMVAVGELSVYEEGLDKPVNLSRFRKTFPDAVKSELEQALACAMKTGHFKGGIVPVFLLGQTNDPSLCYGLNEPSVLVQAVRSPDRRLRFAAAVSVVRLNPSKSYIGSSRVPETLMEFARSTGEQKAIVAHPRLDRALILGNTLSQRGYRVIPVNTGGAIVSQAQRDPDVELVLATDTIRTPEIRTVVQQLENDYRTSDIAVAIGVQYGPETPTPTEFVRPRPHAIEVPIPLDDKSGEWSLKTLFDKTKPEHVPATERLKQGKTAASLLLKLMTDRSELYHIEDIEPFIRQLIATPVMSESGLALARAVPTLGMQNHLVNLVGDVRLPVEIRRKILNALTDHFKRHGVLLRGPDIVRFYDRYNASEKEDRDTQQILSSALDSYESVRGEKRL